MPDGKRNGSIWRTSLAAALLFGLAQAPANAQQDYWAKKGATVSDAQVTPASSGSELADIERRLATLEAVNGLTYADGIGGQCVEVEIQTRPNHQVIGRMFFDQLWMDNLPGVPPLLPPQSVANMTGFRDLRLGVQGNIWENLAYKVEFDFAGGSPNFAGPVTGLSRVDFKDAYGEIQSLPWLGNFRFGRFREPMGLEHLTDARFITLMERSAPTRAFAPDRNLGIMLYNDFGGPDGTQNWSWFAGLFRGNSVDNQPVVNRDANDWAGTFRVAGLPYYDEATPGRCLLHVGVSGSTRRTGGAGGTFGNGDMQGFLGLDNRNSFLNIDLAPGQEYGVLGLEAAWVRGAFSLQGEYFFSGTGNTAGINTNGGYVTASYFLTGENRGYDKRSKAFYRVKPYEPFFRIRTADGIATGIGAWEVAARYSYTDLNSIPALAGVGTTTALAVIGTQENITLGCNWYLNPYSRIMCNYVHSISDYAFLGKAEGDHVGLRLQVDW